MKVSTSGLMSAGIANIVCRPIILPTFSCRSCMMSHRSSPLVARSKVNTSTSRRTYGGLVASRNAQAFYSQLRLAWRDRLFVTSGFRVDDAFTYGTHVNPRVSAAFVLPGLNTKLRGGYSRGLKAASFLRKLQQLRLLPRRPQPETGRIQELGNRPGPAACSGRIGGRAEPDLVFLHAYQPDCVHLYGSAGADLSQRRADPQPGA